MAAGMREIQALTVVGVVPIRLAVVRGGLICQDGLRPVLEILKAGPDAIVAVFQRKGSTRPDLAQRRQRIRELSRIDLDASLVGFGAPLIHAYFAPRRQR